MLGVAYRSVGEVSSLSLHCLSIVRLSWSPAVRVPVKAPRLGNWRVGVYASPSPRKCSCSRYQLLD